MSKYLNPWGEIYYVTSQDGVVYAQGGDDEIYGHVGDDIIWGEAGHDWLYGGNGRDFLYGGEGHDHLYGEDGADNLYGDNGDDLLSGASGDDMLRGGFGFDALFGGLGDDNYVIDDGNDSVVEYSGQGYDRVSSLVSYTLSSNVEGLTLLGSALDGYGNSLNNSIAGNGNNNSLWGRAGHDDLYGEAGNDGLYGEAGWDYLYGGSGDDWLDGGTEADAMYGGAGNDVYTVDDIADYVSEAALEGLDSVYAHVSYTLPDYVDNLILYGSARDGTGNSMNNRIEGNNHANTLRGGDGYDTLYGWAANDYLVGGASGDTMYGGFGDDLYDVNSTADVVIEYAGQGNDDVISSVTYTLSAEVEDLFLITAGAINGTGNAAANEIYGNPGNNVLRGEGGNDELHGGGGNDTMYGGTGSDTFYVTGTGVSVVEYLNQGFDEVISTISYALPANVEDLRLLDINGAINGTGNELDNDITGNGSINRLSGLGGNDWLEGGGGDDSLWGDAGIDALVGGSGADVMYGGTGEDWFYFNSVAETGDGVRADYIADFSAAEGDTICLSGIDANTTVSGNQAFTYIGASAFTGVAGQLNYLGGFVQGDTNGDSVGDFWIEVNAPRLWASDFVL
jgi:Ca2+-binding RTX toxin-like protein